MVRVNINAHHYVQARRAMLVFDFVTTERSDMVSAWDILDPRIVVHAPDTLDDPLHRTGRAWYRFEIDGNARGIFVPRPTWLDDELDPAAPPELPP